MSPVIVPPASGSPVFAVRTLFPSTAITQALTLTIVVSEACHSSILPTHRAVAVEAVSQEIGSQVQEVRVPADGVPISGVVRVIPASVNAALHLLRATEVVPI